MFSRVDHGFFQKDVPKELQETPLQSVPEGPVQDGVRRCHNCQVLNHFARDCKAKKKEEVTGSKAYYLAKLKELEDSEKAFMVMKQELLDYQVCYDGDDDEEEEKANCLMAVNVEKEVLKEITGVRGAVKKNYCFMVNSTKPSGVTIVEHVRIMISDLKYDLISCDPYLLKLELTMKDVLSASDKPGTRWRHASRSYSC